MRESRRGPLPEQHTLESRAMRSLLHALGLAVALFVAAPAHAQFENRSIGLSAGYMSFNDTASLGSTAFLGFDASHYIESGFELVSLTKLAFPLDPVSGKRVIGLAPSLGIRYLFMEESIRPYVGADLSYLHVFKPQAGLGFVGVGPNAGVELFVSDSISLGARAQFNAYLSLEERVQTSLIVSGGSSVYF
jgi:outer membrane protein